MIKILLCLAFVLYGCQSVEEVSINSITESENDSNVDTNILVVYFSQADYMPDEADAISEATPSVGNTQSIAFTLQEMLQADIFAIETEETYPINHSEASEIAREEMEADARPIITTHIENMEKYETVFIGYPIWWYIEPMAIRTFLETYDFSNKTVVPFCTSLAVDIAQSEENIASMIPEATMLQGQRFSTGQNHTSEIKSWLEEIGIGENT